MIKKALHTNTTFRKHLRSHWQQQLLPVANMTTTLLLSATLAALAITINATVVKNENELKRALENAKPGDVIELQERTYRGNFVINNKKGTKKKPITLRGPRTAILEGTGGLDHKYVLHVSSSDYWIIQGFTLKNAQKGIVLDRSNFCQLDDLRITYLGMEAVHFRLTSSDNVVEKCDITDTGIKKPGFGEGVYVGSSRDKWPKILEGKRDACDRNKILNNKIGPDVRGENVDIKEGTQDGEISGNVFDGNGLTGKASDGSWINVKGNNYYISRNRGYNTIGVGIRNGIVLKGWGEANVYDGNVLDVRSSGNYGIFVKKGATKQSIVYDNNKATGAKALTNIKVTHKEQSIPVYI